MNTVLLDAQRHSQSKHPDSKKNYEGNEEMMKRTNVKGMAVAAVIAALYFALTVMPGLSALAYGGVQFRVSEALCVLPLFTPWAIPGLTIGCVLANLMSPMPMDLIVGPTASLLAALAMYWMRNHKLVALLFPALLNGLLVGLMLTMGTGGLGLFLYNFAGVAFGELVVLYALGYPLTILIEKKNLARYLTSR